MALQFADKRGMRIMRKSHNFILFLGFEIEFDVRMGKC